MTISLWELIGLAMAVLGGFWGLAKLLLAQSQKQIAEQFLDIKNAIKTGDEATRRLEREILELKAELPRDYVRREDYMQAVGTIMAKLDAMALRFENIFLRDKQDDRRTH